MKRIGIDARLYSKTGVGVYIRNLLHYLQKQPADDITFYIYVLEKEADQISFHSPHFIKRPVSYLWHSLSEQIGFLRILNRDNLDLMHFTYYSYPVLYRKKFIATMHDTILQEYKTGKASTKNRLVYELKHLVYRYVVWSQVHNAKAIITPTETVKKNIVRLFDGRYESKIHPIFEGVNYALFTAKENKNLDIKFSGPFFIYIGNFYPHKNVESLVKAFSRAKIDAKLLLIGPADFFSKRIASLISELHQSERIIIFNDVTIENLVYFYKNAKALIHPSFSEGFGLPLVEAAYFGLPVIASDIAVFKELLAENFIRINPSDVDDITQKIESFNQFNSSLDYSEVLKKYSFEKMTNEIFNLYKKYL